MRSDRQLSHRTDAIRYAEHEGSGIGTTMLMDVGTYEIVTSASSLKAGRDHDPDTSDEEDRLDVGLKHERALARQYRDTSRGKRSITLLLKGERYTLRINMSNYGHDYRYTLNKLSGRVLLRRNWLITPAINPATGDIQLIDHYALTPMENRSLLSGRTIDEIKADPRSRSEHCEGEEDGLPPEISANLDAVAAETLLHSLRG